MVISSGGILKRITMDDNTRSVMQWLLLLAFFAFLIITFKEQILALLAHIPKDILIIVAIFIVLDVLI